MSLCCFLEPLLEQSRRRLPAPENEVNVCGVEHAAACPGEQQLVRGRLEGVDDLARQQR